MKKLLSFLFILCLSTGYINGENGYDLWLRYKPLSDFSASKLKSLISNVLLCEDSPVLQAALEEIQVAWRGFTGSSLPQVGKAGKGTVMLVNRSVKEYSHLLTEDEWEACGKEGFIIKPVQLRTGNALLIAGNGDAGVLYGAFTLLRMIATGQNVGEGIRMEKPAYELRLLNHWDNLNGTVERGYAGKSIWWNRDDDKSYANKQYRDYARANASVGINGTVLNNVNASPTVLTTEKIREFAAVADILRPYNIKVYMSVNFSSPAVLGGLPDSDPLRTEVKEWWKSKVREIYDLIPDFGGFLVKANSEGQPGPQNFGRTHAEGANMLAEVLKPYQGVVMWRAFVYEPSQEDRAKQAYNEFIPLDGSFADNVIIQVKNGPVDFQPREPFSPLFGAMKSSSLMVEFQITQEYLGFSDHLVYLAPLQKECLNSDTWQQGKGSTVAKATDGSLYVQSHTAIAGVANIGRDTNWCGHHFAQANWYAFGRLAWNHSLQADQIALEWLQMTFTPESSFLEPALDIMMRSREAAVNYMTPMGLHHLMGWGHHYGPEPWTDIRGARPDWLPSYYHKASLNGIGFDRSSSGSGATQQYASPLREILNDPTTCPPALILWFHHLPWGYRLPSGRTVWDELCHRYACGVSEVRLMQSKWDRLEDFTDRQRFQEIQRKLKIQTKEAMWWRDACLLYFQEFSRLPIPAELERPIHDLQEMKKTRFNLTNHN